MNKFTLLTFNSYKDELLKALQRFENVHFKDLQKGDNGSDLDGFEKDFFPEDVSAIEGELAKINFSLEKIKPFAEMPKGLKALTEPRKQITYDQFNSYTNSYDYASVYAQIKEADEQLKSLNSEKERAKNDSQNLNPWIKMDTSIDEMERLRSITYFIGSINRANAEAFRQSVESTFDCSYVEFFGGIKDELTALIVAPSTDYGGLSELLKNVGFTRQNLSFTGIPSELVKQNSAKISDIEKKEASIQDGMKKFGAEYPKLLIARDFFNTTLERARACENFRRLGDVLLIEGWAPSNESQQLGSLLRKVCGDAFYLEETPGEKDGLDTPVKLKNNMIVSAFEDITSMYSTPRYNEIDPTPVMTPFYIAFFGLMVGDAGYGALMLIATALALKTLNLGKSTANFVRFLHYLSYAIIAAGVLYGSVFGFAFPPFLFMQTQAGPKAILDSEVDIQLMLILSIVVGIFHVLFGVGVKGYALVKEGKVFAAVFDSVFYITAIMGGIGMILSLALPVPSLVAEVVKWMFYLSLIGLAATQGRESPSLGSKIGSGLYAVYGLTGYVGDIISYTRIVALGLSGAYIAKSFNIMGGLVIGDMGSSNILKIIFGLIIIILGQTLNIGLGVLGAYVHTCRLQYVEFFGKFYEGGGKAFKPLALKNEAVEITD